MSRGKGSLGHLGLVGCKGRQHLLLLESRDVEEVKRAAEFRRDGIELLGRDLQVAMGLPLLSDLLSDGYDPAHTSTNRAIGLWLRRLRVPSIRWT